MQRSRMIVRLAIVAAAFTGTFVLTQVAAPAAAASPPLATIPLMLGDWRGAPAPPLTQEAAEILAADQYVHRYYNGPLGLVEMDVAYYTRPRVGANMHSPLNCLPGNGWEVVDVQSLTVETEAGAWPVRAVTTQRGDARYVVAYWFQSRSRIVGDELASRAYLLTDALRRRPTDSNLVRLIVPVQDGRTQVPLITDFARQLIPELAARMNLSL